MTNQGALLRPHAMATTHRRQSGGARRRGSIPRASRAAQPESGDISWRRGTPLFEVPGHGEVCWALDSRQRHIWAEWHEPSGAISRLPLDVVAFVVAELDDSHDPLSPADPAWPPAPRDEIEPVEGEVEGWGACSLMREQDGLWWLRWRPSDGEPSVRMPLAAALALISGPASEALAAPKLQRS